MERAHHDGRATAYERFDRGGSGQPVLFVHGSGGHRGVWKGQARLGDERPVVTMDLSGHGDSEDFVDGADSASEPGAVDEPDSASEAVDEPNSVGEAVDEPDSVGDPDSAGAHWGEETLAAYATDVVAVARETGAETLVGNSLGGAVAMRVALRTSFEPARLILAGTGAKLGVLPELLAWLAEDFDRAVSFLHEPNRLLHDPAPALAAASEQAMRETGRAVTERDFRTADAFDVRGEVGAISVPTLAIVGAHDELTPPAFHEYLAAEMPDCEVAVVEEAAHLAMLEQPTAFNAALSAFLDRRCGSV